MIPQILPPIVPDTVPGVYPMFSPPQEEPSGPKDTVVIGFEGAPASLYTNLDEQGSSFRLAVDLLGDVYEIFIHCTVSDYVGNYPGEIIVYRIDFMTYPSLPTTAAEYAGALVAALKGQNNESRSIDDLIGIHSYAAVSAEDGKVRIKMIPVDGIPELRWADLGDGVPYATNDPAFFKLSME